MKGLAELTKTTLIGGLLVVLPIYLSILLLLKTLAAIFALLSPVTAAIPAGTQFRQVFAILIVLAVCLVAGLVVRTRSGRRAKNILERSVLRKIPGYSLVRGLTERVSGEEGEGAFQPALVEIEDALSPGIHHRGAGGRPLHRARAVGADACRRRAVHPAEGACASAGRAVHAGGDGHLQVGRRRGRHGARHHGAIVIQRLADGCARQARPLGVARWQVRLAHAHHNTDVSDRLRVCGDAGGSSRRPPAADACAGARQHQLSEFRQRRGTGAVRPRRALAPTVSNSSRRPKPSANRKRPTRASPWRTGARR